MTLEILIRAVKNGHWIVNDLFRSKIFCISFQRTGTTSTGKFFKDHGFLVAGYPRSIKNKWTSKWFKGDYQSIFNSFDFKIFQVFEDDPWWCQDFYKVLYHRFPSAKFILLERDSDKWFDSMVSHSDGMTLGNTHRHTKIYRRETEFYALPGPKEIYSARIDNLLPLQESHRGHYKMIYELRNKEVREFFNTHNPSRLFHARLEDKDLWQQMGGFFGITVGATYRVHVNKSEPNKVFR